MDTIAVYCLQDVAGSCLVARESGPSEVVSLHPHGEGAGEAGKTPAVDGGGCHAQLRGTCL